MASGRSQKNKDPAVTNMSKDVKIPKPPKQPEKPLFPYMRYSRRVWESVKSTNPEMKMWDIGKVVGEQWRNLSDEERQGYFDEYEVEKQEFAEAMKSYHNSTAYREWVKAKEKAQNAIQEKQMVEKVVGGSVPKEEPRFQLQQAEEDEDDDSFYWKHIATARFQRNHRLINEIFGDSTVPDIKTIVTKPRLENLKRQVQSLMQHQRKLESEIVNMEDRFAAKKRKIMEQSEKFEQTMKEISERPLPPLPEPDSTEDSTSENTDAATKSSETLEDGTVKPFEEKMEVDPSTAAEAPKREYVATLSVEQQAGDQESSTTTSSSKLGEKSEGIVSSESSKVGDTTGDKPEDAGASHTDDTPSPITSPPIITGAEQAMTTSSASSSSAALPTTPPVLTPAPSVQLLSSAAPSITAPTSINTPGKPTAFFPSTQPPSSSAPKEEDHPSEKPPRNLLEKSKESSLTAEVPSLIPASQATSQATQEPSAPKK